MSITTKSFGKISTGEEATLYELKNKNGMTVTLTNYGANVVHIIVPDAKGNFEDVNLGYDTVSGYEANGPGFGSFIGRHANRIEGAKFTINGNSYELDKNDGENNLHGGSKSYNKYFYDVEYYEEEDNLTVEFSRVSPHMEQGFPGNLDITVTYTLTDNNELMIEYFAVSDEDTIVNFTNHSYFNLAGHNAGNVEDQLVMINASQFTPTDDALIPTGELRDVKGTPMDFTTLKPIGRDINSDYTPLVQAGGYDHNYVLDKTSDDVELCAKFVDEKSGRVMEVFTDLPGMQFYTANFLANEAGKGGVVYQKRAGACFETQYFPNSCNIHSFPSPILKEGQEFDSVTIFKFSTL